MITVNAKAFAVRYNLFTALHTIRQTWLSNTVWWIDPLCINQDDIPERSRQVASMKDIYASSAGTVVWLGPSDEMTHMAYFEIASLSESWNKRMDCLKKSRVRKEDLKEYTDIVRSEFSKEDPTQSWDALQSLLSRYWFDRAWVLQEVCAAPGTIVQCGDCKICWTEMLDVRRVIMQHLGSIERATSLKIRSGGEILTYLLTGTQSWQDLENSIFTYRSAMETSEGPSLITVLNQLRPMRATDLRDKVYAAFGLANIDEQTPVDYSLSVETVYINTIRKSIQVTRSFHMLAYCIYPPKLGSLPSWVVDWTDNDCIGRVALPQKGFHRFTSQNQERLYRTAEASDPCVRWENDGRTMIAKAILLNEIAFVSTGSCHEHNDAELVRRERLDSSTLNRYAEESDDMSIDNYAVIVKCKWLREWALFQLTLDAESFSLIDRSDWLFEPQAEDEIFEEPTYKPTNESFREAYIRTVAADVMVDDVKGLDVRLPKSSEGINQTLHEGINLSEAFAIRLEGRAFGVSGAGLISLVPTEARVHDLIAIVQGSEVPFILRRSENDFLFIGQA